MEEEKKEITAVVVDVVRAKQEVEEALSKRADEEKSSPSLSVNVSEGIGAHSKVGG